MSDERLSRDERIHPALSVSLAEGQRSNESFGIAQHAS